MEDYLVQIFLDDEIHRGDVFIIVFEANGQVINNF